MRMVGRRQLQAPIYVCKPVALQCGIGLSCQPLDVVFLGAVACMSGESPRGGGEHAWHHHVERQKFGNIATKSKVQLRRKFSFHMPASRGTRVQQCPNNAYVIRYKVQCSSLARAHVQQHPKAVTVRSESRIACPFELEMAISTSQPCLLGGVGMDLSRWFWFRDLLSPRAV